MNKSNERVGMTDILGLQHNFIDRNVLVVLREKKLTMYAILAWLRVGRWMYIYAGGCSIGGGRCQMDVGVRWM